MESGFLQGDAADGAGLHRWNGLFSEQRGLQQDPDREGPDRFLGYPDAFAGCHDQRSGHPEDRYPVPVPAREVVGLARPAGQSVVF